MADVAYSAKDYDFVAQRLNRLLDEFELVPTEHRDVRIRERLMKGAAIAQRSRTPGHMPTDVANELGRLAKLLGERGTIHSTAPIGQRVFGEVVRIVVRRQLL